MHADMWARKIGAAAYGHIARKSGLPDDVIASVLDAAVEVGFAAPEQAPVVDPRGFWTGWRHSNGAVLPTITPDGLLRHLELGGHGVLGLRLGPLFRGVGALLLPRLQEIVAAYELQCRTEGVPTAPVDHGVFVGGSGWSASDDQRLTELRQLCREPATPERAVARVQP